jgi:capsular polysaccharide biosynthesis protein
VNRDGKRHVVLAVATFVLVAIATMLAAFLPPERFQATAVVSVEPDDTDVSTQLVNFLIPTVEARIEGQSLASEVSSRLPAELANSGWEVETRVEPGSGVMRITVASDNRDVPMVTANAYAQILDEQIPGTDVLDAVVVDLAARTVVVSQRPTVLVSGLALATILAFLMFVGLRRPSRTGAPEAMPAGVPDRPAVAGPVTAPKPYAGSVRSGR